MLIDLLHTVTTVDWQMKMRLCNPGHRSTESLNFVSVSPSQLYEFPYSHPASPVRNKSVLSFLLSSRTHLLVFFPILSRCSVISSKVLNDVASRNSMSLSFIDTCLDVSRRHSTNTIVETAVTDRDYPADNTPPFSQVSDADFEAKNYYYGLPSRPVLVYQTGTPWEKPTHSEAYLQARPVFNHSIVGAWDELGPQVPDYLDSMDIMWTAIDVVCFAVIEEKPGPPVLWIGVKPGSLSRHGEDAKVGPLVARVS